MLVFYIWLWANTLVIQRLIRQFVLVAFNFYLWQLQNHRKSIFVITNNSLIVLRKLTESTMLETLPHSHNYFKIALILFFKIIMCFTQTTFSIGSASCVAHIAFSTTVAIRLILNHRKHACTTTQFVWIYERTIQSKSCSRNVLFCICEQLMWLHVLFRNILFCWLHISNIDSMQIRF